MDLLDSSLVAFRHPAAIWQNHRTFLCEEILVYILGLLTFCHACRNGGRYIYLWFSTILHGLVVESLSYVVPDIDNFWHAQSMLMLIGKRLPLHVIFLYPVLIYTSVAAVNRLRLKAWAEPCAVGVAVVLLDIPFDIVGVKQLFWTWHDTDPNILDRHYHVPWTSYYFHASFAAGFTFLFHGTRSLIGHAGGWATKMEADGFFKETVCTLFTGMLAMPLGILQFVPIYHSLHDIFHIHAEVCVLCFLALFFLIAWSSDRNPIKDARTTAGFFDELGLLVLIHYAAYIVFAVIEQPEMIRSIGMHQPTGNCSSLTPVHTPMGQVLTKQTYLCSSAYDEPYFDFHCLPGGKAPADGLSWYKVCGTPHVNPVEHILVVSSFSLFGFFVFMQLLSRSGRQSKGRYAMVNDRPGTRAKRD